MNYKQKYIEYKNRYVFLDTFIKESVKMSGGGIDNSTISHEDVNNLGQYGAGDIDTMVRDLYHAEMNQHGGMNFIRRIGNAAGNAAAAVLPQGVVDAAAAAAANARDAAAAAARGVRAVIPQRAANVVVGPAPPPAPPYDMNPPPADVQVPAGNAAGNADGINQDALLAARARLRAPVVAPVPVPTQPKKKFKVNENTLQVLADGINHHVNNKQKINILYTMHVLNQIHRKNNKDY